MKPAPAPPATMNTTSLQKYVQEHPVCPSLDAWLSEHLADDHKQLYATILQLRTEVDDIEYPVNFDTLWPALGYTRKDNAKAKLEKICSMHRDYVSLLRAQERPLLGGQNAEDIFLTFNAAQIFALQAATSRSREIADFFIAALEIVQKYHLLSIHYDLQVGHQAALEVERQARLAAEGKALALQVKLAGKNIPGQQLYVLQNPADGNRKLYKLGRTKDLSKRVSGYGTAIPDGATVLHTVSCIDSVASEKLARRALEPYQYNGEWYQCDLSVITHVMDAVVLANDGIVRGATYLEKYNVVERMRSTFAEIEAGEDIVRNAKRSPERSPSPVQLVKRRLADGAGLIKGWLGGGSVLASQNPATGDTSADEEAATTPRSILDWIKRHYKLTGVKDDYVIRQSMFKLYSRVWNAEEDGAKRDKAGFNEALDAVLRGGLHPVGGQDVRVVFGLVLKGTPTVAANTMSAKKWFDEYYELTGDNEDFVIKPAVGILYEETWDEQRHGKKEGGRNKLYKDLDVFMRSGKKRVGETMPIVFFGVRKR